MNTGYYGKIPSRGDFISRKLPRDFIEIWDPWLQQGLSSSKDRYDDDWLDIYLTSPLWSFILTKGVCQQDAWIGVMMPSVDKVGRYFPLTLAKPVAKESSPFSTISAEQNWFNQARELSLSTLEDNFDMEHFHQELARLDSQPTPNIQRQGTTGQNQTQWRIGSKDLYQGMAILLGELLADRFASSSLWWCDGSEHMEPSVLLCQSLPSAKAFVSLLDGNWQQGNWLNKFSLQEGLTEEQTTI